MNVCEQQEMQRELEALSYMDGSEDNASPASCWNSKHDNWNPFSLGCWCITNFPIDRIVVSAKPMIDNATSHLQ